MAVGEIAVRVREAVGDAAGALVLFHGRGVDENDLFPLLDLLDPERRLVGVCPRGPLTIPPGGSHWYVVKRVGFPDPSTFLPTYEAVGAWLDGLLAERDIAIDRTILGGFSQGAVMTYSLGLGAGRPQPAALIAFSGFIPTVEGFEIDLSNRDGLRVAVGHGIYDPVIGVEFAREAKAKLEPASVALTYRESEMAHTIDPGFLSDLVPWVRAAV